MELRELIKKIRQEKNWTQVQMGNALKINQQDVQGMENAGRNLEKQFSIFLKLTKVCGELGIDPDEPTAQDLSESPPNEREVLRGSTGKNSFDGPTDRDVGKGQRNPENKRPSPIPPRGLTRNRGRQR